MAEETIFSKQEIRFLKELNNRNIRYMVVGLAAAALQGAPVVTQDIDLWFEDLSDPGIKKALNKVGGVYVPQIGLNPPTFAGGGVKLFDPVLHMHGLREFSEEWIHRMEISLEGVSVPVLKLDRIIKSKKAANRLKDRLVIPVLEDVLMTIQTIDSGISDRKARQNKGNVTEN